MAGIIPVAKSVGVGIVQYSNRAVETRAIYVVSDYQFGFVDEDISWRLLLGRVGSTHKHAIIVGRQPQPHSHADLGETIARSISGPATEGHAYASHGSALAIVAGHGKRFGVHLATVDYRQRIEAFPA